jgi:hypothetical protein
MRRQTPGDPVVIVSLQKGLADRNRLPLSHVIKVLQEVRGMIIDAGRELLKERGVEQPTSDFGLELVADESGVTFHKGSLRATVAITRDIEIGVRAAQAVLATVHDLGTTRKTTLSSPPKQLEPTEARIVHRLDRIAFINQTAKAEARFEVKGPKLLLAGGSQNGPVRKSAIFGARAAEAISAYRLPVFEEENLMLYGKLFELKDQNDDEASGFFWGELKMDNGDRWRVQFTDGDQDRVMPLFRRQITVTGTAHYYQTKNPKLVSYSGTVSLDEDRDYDSAFNELFGCEKTAFSAPLDELLRMRYKEE